MLCLYKIVAFNAIPFFTKRYCLIMLRTIIVFATAIYCCSCEINDYDETFTKYNMDKGKIAFKYGRYRKARYYFSHVEKATKYSKENKGIITNAEAKYYLGCICLDEAIEQSYKEGFVNSTDVLIASKYFKESCAQGYNIACNEDDILTKYDVLKRK